jgi:hypothetical protein
MATVCDACLMKMGKALNLWIGDVNRNAFQLVAIRLSSFYGVKRPLRVLEHIP